MRYPFLKLSVLSLLAVTALAVPALAQGQPNPPLPVSYGPAGNQVPAHNGPEFLISHSDPSIGLPTGTFPPDIAGDLFWKAFGGDRVLAHNGDLFLAMEISGYDEVLYTTDWTSPPDFYDRYHGRALPSFTSPENLEPAFFQLGFGAGTFVTLGNSGLGDPCTIAPSLCSPPGGTCPPSGFINGYLVELSLGTTPGNGVIVSAEGSAFSNLATTYFLPGGMTGTGGICGDGNYVYQHEISTNEMEGGTTPYSEFGGYQLAGIASGPVAHMREDTPTATIAFREPVLNPLANGVTGPRGGGGTRGFRLPVATGLASLGIELRSENFCPSASIAAAGASLAPLPPPGIPALGGWILVVPDGLFSATSGSWLGPLVNCVHVGPALAIPAIAVGTQLYLQGFVFDLAQLERQESSFKDLRRSVSG